jgi:hypothetical protein
MFCNWTMRNWNGFHIPVSGSHLKTWTGIEVGFTDALQEHRRAQQWTFYFQKVAGATD